MAATIYQGDSSSPSTHQWDYDVFLSFRGKDTRNGFTTYLYRALREKCINTFMDNDLEKGETISGKLVEHIKSSMISIIIFSQNYAFSSWCLDELVEILKCKQNGQLVLPVFYKVYPYEVREQKGIFEVALAEQQNKFKHSIEKVQRWRDALFEAANVHGWHYKDDYPEYVLIEDITRFIWHNKFCGRQLFVAEYPVEVISRAMAIESDLDIEANDFRMLGSYGFDGIGMTSIAKAVLKKIAKHFDITCILENVGKNSRTLENIIQLQKKILLNISMGKDLNVDSVAHGTKMIREWLQKKRVILILDGVDEPKQIENLIGSCVSLVSRSRVLITTSDKKVLATLEKVCKTHKVKEFDKGEALRLFNRCTGGLPLDLDIIGSGLCERTKSEWEGARRQYDKFVETVLKVFR